MKRIIILPLFLLLAIPLLLLADDYIYDSPYGGKKVGRIDEKGYIYDDAYGGKKIGRVEDGVVYDSAVEFQLKSPVSSKRIPQSVPR